MEDLLGYVSDEETKQERERPPVGKRKHTATTAGDTEEAGSAHQRRIRGFPHVEGNYPTHTYIAVSIPDHIKPYLRRLLHSAREHIPGLQTGHEALPENNQPIADLPHDYHLSLSRPVAIRYRDRDSLLAALRDCLRKTARFQLELTELEYFANDERTRSFLALSVTEGRKEACRAIKRVDRAYVQHDLQAFYKDPRPHVSIAWALGDREEALEGFISRWTSMQIEDKVSEEAKWQCQISVILCKIGQHVYKVWSAGNPIA